MNRTGDDSGRQMILGNKHAWMHYSLPTGENAARYAFPTRGNAHSLERTS